VRGAEIAGPDVRKWLVGRPPSRASLLAMALCLATFFVYISVAAVAATNGSAFTAGYLEKPQVTKGSCP